MLFRNRGYLKHNTDDETGVVQAVPRLIEVTDQIVIMENLTTTPEQWQPPANLLGW